MACEAEKARFSQLKLLRWLHFNLSNNIEPHTMALSDKRQLPGRAYQAQSVIHPRLREAERQADSASKEMSYSTTKPGTSCADSTSVSQASARVRPTKEYEGRCQRRRCILCTHQKLISFSEYPGKVEGYEQHHSTITAP